MRQLWLFLVIPSVGGAAAGLLFRTRLLEAGDPAAAQPELTSSREQVAL